MTWSDQHARSEQLAEAAHEASRRGDGAAASVLFAEAAQAETDALAMLTSEKPRTYGVTAVSAVALWYKAGKLEEAERLAHCAVGAGFLPDFAVDDLRTLLQAIWNELARREAGITFAPGQVLVSIKGGDVVRGGAPLELIVEKAQAVQRLFYRTAEYLKGVPLRTKGLPTRELLERCRPWLFQSVPGSYQFAVAIQEPRQRDLFGDPYPRPKEITETFLSILRAATDAPETGLQSIVTKEDYRQTFLKMTRNLSPSGKSFTAMEIVAAGDRHPLVLSPSSRKLISDTLRAPKERAQASMEQVTLTGVLRALDLDKDWLEISIDGRHDKITDVGETVDDVIGPMVNHDVIVRAIRTRRGTLSFIDIEQQD
jgi:hypothetical protein